MFGISYGEFFLIFGATAALIGTKDLPKIARTAGRLVGRSIGYVQLFRGQFENVMQQSQANKVHKELQDTMAQLEAIRYEIRSISVMNPGPFTRKLDSAEPVHNSASVSSVEAGKSDVVDDLTIRTLKGMNFVNTGSTDLHSQAMTYARLAEAPSIMMKSSESGSSGEELKDSNGLLNILPVSAESAGLLPSRAAKGSDIVLEAILEAEVANNAKHFFSQPENQLPTEQQ